MFKKKTEQFKIDINDADQTLRNVFAECERTPNSVSIHNLVSGKPLDTRPYDRLLCLAGILLCFLFLIPLFIVPVTEALAKSYNPESVILEEDYVDGNVLYLRFSGDNLRMDEAYLEKADGTLLSPLGYDGDTLTIWFPYISDMESNLYIPVKGRSPVHLLLTPEP